jgi:hypothetical protein
MTTSAQSEAHVRFSGCRLLRKAAVRARATALIAALASAAFLNGLSTPASAHSDLVSSDPSDGSSLTSPPSRLVLTFADGVAPRYTVVTLRVGAAEVATLEATATGDRVIAAVPANMHGKGLWRVAYRVVSADGHSVTGQVVFRVNPPASPEGVPTPDSPSSLGSPGDESAARNGEAPVEVPASSNNRSGLHPGVSVLIIALLVSAPVVVFVVIASRKRREDRQ